MEQVDLGDIDGAENREESLAEEAAEELQRFGSNLFDSEVSTFAPVDNIPVPEGYRLGVGDELRVMLIGKEQGDFPLLVDRDGSVTLPKLGRIVLSGLTFPEAKKLIEKRVSEQLIGSEAVLSMGSLRSISVFIAGEVKSQVIIPFLHYRLCLRLYMSLVGFPKPVHFVRFTLKGKGRLSEFLTSMIFFCSAIIPMTSGYKTAT